MKSGIELIAIERQEQIEKHGRTIIKDVAENSRPVGHLKMQPLLIGAVKCTGVVGGLPWPDNWNEVVCDKIDKKTRKEKLIIAGAFIAAEIDRLNALEE